MQLNDGGNAHLREVAFATKGDVRLTRSLAIMVAVSALVVTAIPLFTPLPWLVALTAIAGIVLLVIAGALWLSESQNAANTARLQVEGVQGVAEIRDAEQIDNESTGYRITFRIRASSDVPIDVIHLCSHWKCVDAVKTHQAGHLACLPVMVAPVANEWMIIH